MATPAATPRILGLRIVGAVPQSPFLYTVAATGQRPMTFAATGLPAGLSIDAATGRITGTIGAAGQTTVTVTATNGMGTDTQPLTIVAGSTLALTPPMGWNSYDSFNDAVTEADVNSQAQAMLQQLQPFGWQYVVVDFRWYDPKNGGSLAMDTNGRLLPAPNRFPSATGSLGFKPLADAMHGMGLQFGIHIMRGIARQATQANSPIAGSTYHAADAANTSDLCPWNSDMYGVSAATAAGQAWYDSIFQQYAQWGIDFVKVDDMLNNQVTPNVYHQAEVDAIRKSIDKTGRSIVLSLSPGEMPVGSSADLTANANMWRMANDFWDVSSQLDHMFVLGNNWQSVNTPGHWPDADMLPLGYLGPMCPVGGNHNTNFTKNEQVMVMSYWAILPSPLILGANMAQLQTDAWTTALLTNEEVLSITEDSSGQRASRVSLQGTQEVWARGLSGGRKAVGLFNRATTDQMIGVTWAQLGVSGTPAVRDVWQRADVVVSGNGPMMNVPYRAAVLLVVSPSPGADGGVSDAGAGALDAGIADGGGGASSSGGGTTDGGSSGGSSGGGAMDGGGSASGSGGSSGGSSSSGDGGGAGSSSSSGSSGGAPSGDAASPGAAGTPSKGCGCEAVGHERGDRPPYGVLLGLLAIGGWRHARRKNCARVVESA